MRNTFARTLTEIARKDPRVILLTADLGYSAFEEYIHAVPDQYINVGVAEQNMAGMAAGLAMEGRIPVIYSIVPFATMRNFEQIRNDIAYQHVNVKIVGVGAGFSYGPYGHTHHGLEDIALMRAIPEMVVLGPGDPVEVKLATDAMLSSSQATYMRLGKAGEPVLHVTEPAFEIGTSIVMETGTDITVIGTSTMLETALSVSAELRKQSLSVKTVSMHTIKPIDRAMIIASAKETSHLVTIEEHSIIGGLASAVSEVLSQEGLGIKFTPFAVADRFTKVIGTQQFMRQANGLSVEQIVTKIRSVV